MSQLTDPIADFLTRLRNSTRAQQPKTVAPYSKIKAEIARILKQEGYITNYEVDTTGKFPQIKVTTKSHNRVSAITGVTTIPTWFEGTRAAGGRASWWRNEVIGLQELQSATVRSVWV